MMPEKEYIEREAVIKKLNEIGNSNPFADWKRLWDTAIDTAVKAVEKLPAAADVAPVKIGDEVFCIFYLINSGVWQMSNDKHIATTIHINKNGVRIVVTNRYGSIKPSDFGDTVFLTREEAEKALAGRSVNNG